MTLRYSCRRQRRRFARWKYSSDEVSVWRSTKTDWLACDKKPFMTVGTRIDLLVACGSESKEVNTCRAITPENDRYPLRSSPQLLRPVFCFRCGHTCVRISRKSHSWQQAIRDMVSRASASARVCVCVVKSQSECIQMSNSVAWHFAHGTSGDKNTIVRHAKNILPLKCAHVCVCIMYVLWAAKSSLHILPIMAQTHIVHTPYVQFFFVPKLKMQ